MPRNYCLNCAKPADFYCKCCNGASHYCSTQCQRIDWHHLHLYEKALYSAPLSDDTLVVKRIEPIQPPRTEPAWRKEALRESERERAEYNTVVERTLELLAERPRTKSVMRMTHSQRLQLQEVLMSAVPSVEDRRQTFRTQFTETLAALAKAVAPLQRVQFDAQQEAQLSRLFRRRDLMNAKQTLALVSGTLQDAQEARRFGEDVEAGERRFVHAFLGFDALLGQSYEAVLKLEQQALQQARLERTLDDILERAFQGTVNTCVNFLQYASDDEENLMKFAQPFGADGTEGGGEGGGVGRANIEGMLGAMRDEEERGTVFSMQHLNNLVAVARGVYAARQQDSVDQGHISEEQRDNSTSFLDDLWRSLADTLRPVVKETGKRAKALVQKVRDAVAERVAEVKRSLGQLLSVQILRVFAVLSVISVLLIAYGLFTYTYSTQSQLDQLDAQLKSVETDAQELQSRTTAQIDDITRERSALDSLTKTLDRSEQKAFLALDHNNDDLESATNRIIINQNLNTIIGTAAGQAKQYEGKLKGRHASEFVETAQKFQRSVDYEERRQLFDEVQTYVKAEAESSVQNGFTHSLQTVDKLLDDRKAFVERMGLSAEAQKATLEKQSETLASMGTTLFNARTAAENTSSGAPFLTSMLRGTGYEFVMDPSMLHPMAEMEAAHFGQKVEPSAFIVSGLQYMGQLEYTTQRVLKTANVFKETWYSARFYGAIAWSLFTMDFGTALFHALTGLSTLLDFGSVAQASWAQLKGMAPKRVTDALDACTRVLFDWIGGVFKFGDDRYDEELKPLVDAIKGETGLSGEERIARALELYNTGQLGGWTESWRAAIKYGRLIELLGDRTGVYAGAAYLNFVVGQGTNWVEKGIRPALYLSRVIGVVYMSRRYVDLFWNLWYILQFVWGALNWPGLALFYAALVFGATIYEKGIRNLSWSNLGISLVVEALIAPVTALMKLTWNHPYAVMTVVYYTYATLSTVDSATGLIQWISPRDEKADASMNGFDKPNSHLYEAADAKRQTELALKNGKTAVDDAKAGLEAGGANVNEISANITSIVGDLLMQADGKAAPEATSAFMRLIYR